MTVRSEVDVWFMETRSIPGRDLTSFEPILSHGELSRSRKFISPDDRRDYVAAHVLVRLALAQEYDRAPGTIAFGAEPSGRPYVRDAPAASVTEFSLSHTREFVGVAIARGARVGIDLERTDRTDQPQELYGRALSAREQRDITSLGPAARRTRFFQLWTLKEAYLKALGTGLSEAPNSVSFDIDGERISLHGVNGGGASDWHFLTRFHDDRLCLSVCHASGHADVRIGDGRELLALSARAPAQKP